MADEETCDAEVGGYDGMFGIYCELAKGHDGPHRDAGVVWYIDSDWKPDG